MRITTSQHSFAVAPMSKVPRSVFQRNSQHKTTFDAGYLVPIFVDEIYPNDTVHMKATFFARLATPIFPTMDNLYMDLHWFFVPNRLLWSNWQKFCGEQVNPGDPVDYLVPTVGMTTGVATNSLGDYLGIPPSVTGLHVSALPFRAYNLIYDYWYRDENLQNSVAINLGDGPDSLGDYALLRRRKRHDYFTSCLPFAQKGDPVSLPLGTVAPVVRLPNAPIWDVYHAGSNVQAPGSSVADALFPNTTAGLINATYTGGVSLDPAGGLVTDLSSATAATINELRLGVTMQQYLEINARGGTRYPEILLAHFGAISPDSRVQWPEYLGGGSTMVNIKPVAQTSESDTSGTPLGDLAGYGESVLRGGFIRHFVEHGILLGIVSVRADYTYQQGVERFWWRQTRYDYYWPVFANLGEQAVLNREIYASGSSTDADVFGYQERWAELRYKPSRISGLYRSTATGTLDGWHYAQKFTALPLLNSDFVVENPPVDRTIAVPSQPHFYFDSKFEMRHARRMPVYSVPGLKRL